MTEEGFTPREDFEDNNVKNFGHSDTGPSDDPRRSGSWLRGKPLVDLVLHARRCGGILVGEALSQGVAVVSCRH